MMDGLPEAIRDYFKRINAHVVRDHGDDGEMNCRCPFPDHDDKHSSFSINLQTGKFNCFGCSRSGNFIQFVARMEHKRIKDVVRFLNSEYKGLGDRLELGEISIPEYENRFNAKDIEPFKLPAYLVDKFDPYYLTRGLTEEDYKFWGGKVYDGLPMVTFPMIHVDGTVVGLVGRYTDGGRIRYMNFEGSQQKDSLYGFNKMSGKDTVVVVEGLIDTHKAYKALHEVADVVGILGIPTSGRQVKYLQDYWKNIVLFLDNDDAGYKETQRLTEVFGTRPLYVIDYFTTLKDPGDMNMEQIQKHYEKRRLANLSIC